MTELTLVSHKLCPYVQRAAISLTEKSVPFERRWIDLSDKPDWFADISPLGKVPVLVVEADGERTPIFESAAILEYLEDTSPHPLHPADAVSRARHRACRSSRRCRAWSGTTRPGARAPAACGPPCGTRGQALTWYSA